MQFLYMPATVRRLVCRTEARSLIWNVNWVIAILVGSGCCSGLKEVYIFYIFGFGPWILRILRNAISDPEQVSRGDRRKGYSGGWSW